MAERASSTSARKTAYLAPRRRLAPNVICMFAEERPAIDSKPRRGNYPRNIVSPCEFRCRALKKARLAREQAADQGDAA